MATYEVPQGVKDAILAVAAQRPAAPAISSSQFAVYEWDGSTPVRPNATYVEWRSATDPSARAEFVAGKDTWRNTVAP